MSRFRILIADDHRILAEGLRGLLEPEFEVVGLAGDGQELVDAAVKLSPDIVVTDIAMPKLNGIEAAAQIRKLGITARVVVLTMQREVEYARRAVAVGVVGYVLKDSASSELVTAVREAIQGRTYIAPLIAGELLRSYQAPTSSDSRPSPLTMRQREVLKLVAEGHSAKEIAKRLGISIRTAEAHKANVLEALRLNSTAELVQYAVRNGIITV